jgi:hypothetical protein
MGLLMNGLIKIPMQFLILLIGILVFTFYQFKQPPLFFNRNEVKQIKESPYADEYQKLEQQHTIAFKQKKQHAEALIKAMDTHNAPAIDAAQINLQRAEAQTDTLRKQGIALMRQNNALAEVNDTNYIFLNFVTSYLPKGLVGLLIAIVFLASMGSTASALNSLASTTVVDIYKRVINKHATDGNYVTASRLATVFWGVVCVLMALYASQVGNLLEAVNKLGSYIYGTILGVFVVAFYLKKVKGHAVFIAAIITEAVVYLCGQLEVVAYLWLNALGCILVVLIALLLNPFVKQKSPALRPDL